jgi:hypothetical protein
MQIGSYFAEKAVERHGIATVYMGRSEASEFSEPVLITVFTPKPDAPLAEWVERLKTIRALRHPNIRVFTGGGKLSEGRFYTVSPIYAPFIRANTTITPDEARELSRSASSALDYAHSKGIIHGFLRRVHIVRIPATSPDDPPGGTTAVRGFELSLNRTDALPSDDIEALARILRQALGDQVTPAMLAVLEWASEYATAGAFHAAFEKALEKAVQKEVDVPEVSAPILPSPAPIPESEQAETENASIEPVESAVPASERPNKAASVPKKAPKAEAKTETSRRVPIGGCIGLVFGIAATVAIGMFVLQLRPALSVEQATATAIALLPTETATHTATLTPTSTETPTDTPTLTPSRTDEPTATITRTLTRTPTSTVTRTETPTDTPTETLTETPTETATPTQTETPAETETPIPTQALTEPCVNLVGDSVTHGGAVYEVPGVGYMIVELTPVAVFFERRFQELGMEIQGVDRGVSMTGISSSNHPSYWDSGAYSAILSDGCHWTVVMPWVNDITPGIPPDIGSQRHIGSLNTLVTNIVENNPYTTVYVLNYFTPAAQQWALNTWAAGYTAQGMTLYNREIAVSCQSGVLSTLDTVVCVDINRAFEGMGTSYVIGPASRQQLLDSLYVPLNAQYQGWLDFYFGSNPNGVIVGDGIHLSTPGKIALARYMVDLMLAGTSQ